MVRGYVLILGLSILLLSKWREGGRACGKWLIFNDISLDCGFLTDKIFFIACIILWGFQSKYNKWKRAGGKERRFVDRLKLRICLFTFPQQHWLRDNLTLSNRETPFQTKYNDQNI